MRRSRVYESVLYAEDVVAITALHVTSGVERGGRPDELLAAFRLPDGGLLMILDRRAGVRPGRPAGVGALEILADSGFRPGAVVD